MARRDIEFDADGVTLRGWFYPAEKTSGAAPTVVMAHGFSAVKEMYLDSYAEVFAAAGLNAVVFDNRNFGASDGEPRQEIDPWAQIGDYRHAITFATTLPEVDGDRIGIWGSSYSGGHVLVVGAIDRRVKAVVSQVPMVSGHDNFRALVRADSSLGSRVHSTPTACPLPGRPAGHAAWPRTVGRRRILKRLDMNRLPASQRYKRTPAAVEALREATPRPPRPDRREVHRAGHQRPEPPQALLPVHRDR